MPEPFDLFILPDRQAISLHSITELGELRWIDVTTGIHWLFEVYTKRGSYKAIYKTEFEALTQRAILHSRIVAMKEKDVWYVGYRKMIGKYDAL